MTALLLMLFFLMSIFMIVQFMLRDTINSQDSELDSLSQQVASLAEALGLEQQKSFGLENRINDLDNNLKATNTKNEAQATLIATLTQQTNEQSQNIDNFEAQVAALLSEKNELATRLEVKISENIIEVSKKEALQVALAQARDEIDLKSEKARLAAAEADALELLLDEKKREILEMDLSLQDALAVLSTTKTEVSNLNTSVERLNAELSDLDKEKMLAVAARKALAVTLKQTQNKLTLEEKQRLTQMAVTKKLREKLTNSSAELTAMSLVLEEQRKRAQNTLSLLAAARSVENNLNRTLATALLTSENYQKELKSVMLELSSRKEEIKAVKDDAIMVKASLEERLALALSENLKLASSNRDKVTAAEQQAILLSAARDLLSEEKQKATDAQLQTEVLNQQVATLRKQLGSLQNLLNVAKEQEVEVKLQLETFGSDLNIALAKLARKEKEKANIEKAKAEVEKAKAESERAKAKLEIDNAILLDQQAKLLRERNTKLENFKSEFFGQIRKLIEAEDGINISGDRFVFSSEILFASGDAKLSREGKEQIKKIANLISSISDRIPDNIDWILRVDGHTDDKPIRGGKYSNNWELSQARALSVVFYMQEFLNIPAYRLAATGFGEYQPLNKDNTEEARALNRRIEIKLTEK
jgi:chemotaxis protein MotB